MGNSWDGYIYPGTNPYVSSSYIDPDDFWRVGPGASTSSTDAGDDDSATTTGDGGEEELAEFTIPDDAYPQAYSSTSLPQWGLDTIQGLTGRMPGLLDDIEGFAADLANPATVDQWVQKSGDAFWSGLDPFANYLRQPFEKANARGLGDGTYTRDLAINMGGLLADDYRENQDTTAAEAIKQKSENLANAASILGALYNYTGDLFDPAQVTTSSSTDKGALYELMSNLLLG